MLLKQQLKSSPLQIQIILPNNDASGFYNLLNRPAWYMEHFIPAFDSWRKEHQGIILLAEFEKYSIGTIYVELNPPHLVHGEIIPVFGWLECQNQYIANQLLFAAESYVLAHNGNRLRGPINHPKFFGGWGVLVEPQDQSFLVNNTHTSSKVGVMLENAGYRSDTEYISVLQHPTIPKSKSEYPNIEFVNRSIVEMISDTNLMSKIQTLMQNEFSRFLPDFSTGGEFQHIITELLEIGNGEDFVTIAMDINTDAIAGMIINIPNLFDIWSGHRLKSVDVNTVIIAKDYRGLDFFHYLYYEAARKATARGIDNKIGTCIWSENVAAIKSFGQFSDQIQRYRVYTKDLKVSSIN